MILERELSPIVRFAPEKEAFDCRCANSGFLKVYMGIASSSSGLKTTGGNAPEEAKRADHFL